MMYSIFYQLESAVKSNIAEGDYAGALEKLKQFIISVMNEQATPGEVVGAAKVDRLCEMLGDEYFERFFQKTLERTPFKPAENRLVIVCTGLYKYGGTSLVISDLVRAHPGFECTVIATNFLNDMSEEDLKLSRIEGSGASVSICKQGSADEKLHWLIQQFIDIAPSRIFLLNHHQDSVIIAGARPFVDKTKVIFYHHADYNICLGVHLEGAIHVDPHNVGFYNCRHKENIRDNAYVPLTVDDHGVNRVGTSFISDGELKTCSSGTFHKFKNFYLYPYTELLIDRFKVRSGKHVHIGGIPAEDLAHIHQKCTDAGIDPNRFVHIPWTASLWQTLVDEKIDLFIGSFPIGGARTTIEVMGAGLPILMPDNYLSRFFSSRDIVYEDAFLWRYPADFAKIISEINSKALRIHSAQSRAHYLLHYSSQCIDVEGKFNSICAGAPIPPPYALYPHVPDHLDKALHFSHISYLTSSHAVQQAVAELRGANLAVETEQYRGRNVKRNIKKRFSAFLKKASTGGMTMGSKIKGILGQDRIIGQPSPIFEEDFENTASATPHLSPESLVAHLPVESKELYWAISREPHSIGFNADSYLQRNPDVASAKMEPLLHFVEYGVDEGRASSFFFLSDWHAEMNEMDGEHPRDVLQHIIQRRSRPSMKKVAFFAYSWNVERRIDNYTRELVNTLANMGMNVDVYIGGQFVPNETNRGFRPDLAKADLNAFLRSQSYDFAISFNNALIMPETVDALSCTIVSVIVDSIHHLFDHTEGGLWRPFTLPIHAAPIYTALLEDIKAVDGVRASASFMPAATQVEGREMKAGDEPIAISWIASMVGDYNLDNFMSRVEDEIPSGLELVTRCLSDIEQFGEISKQRASQDAARALCEWADWDYPLLEMHLQEVVTNSERLAVVERLAPLGLKIFGNSRWRTALSLSANVARSFQSGGALRRHADLCAIYDRSKISINLPQIHAGTGMQYRILDILASKSLLITKHIAGSDMERLFGTDSPIVTFSDLDDLEAKCAYYLKNEKERLARVKACNAMVAKGFSFKERVLEYLELSNPSQAHHAGAIKERGSVSLIWPDRVIDWAARQEPEAA